MSRKEFTPKTKLAAWERSGHRCEIIDGVGCGVLIRPGNGPEYHHIIGAYFDGCNELENCQVLCIGCHKAVTRKQAPVIAKSRRLLKTSANAKKTKRGFRKPEGYKYNWETRRYEKV